MQQFTKVKSNGFKYEDMSKVIKKILKMERKMCRKRIKRIRTTKTNQAKNMWRFRRVNKSKSKQIKMSLKKKIKITPIK